VALLVPLWVFAAAPAGAAPAAAANRADDQVTMTVERITPWTATPSRKPRSLTVQLRLVSNTQQDVTVQGERGAPLQTQAALDAALADPNPPTTPGQPIPAHPAATAHLDPGLPSTVLFQTRTSTIDDGSGICLCAARAVYPLFFSAHTTSSAGVDQLLGAVATYLPAFYPAGFHEQLLPTHVSWLWPLLDRPHRLASETEFTDDDLAAEVSSGGRLSRALQVVEQVGDSVPITLLIDPDLLDELWVMAHEDYQVRDGTKLVAGVGKDAAASWLAELRSVLTTDAGVQVELTPYADPDVQALSAAGLTWANGVPPAMTAHVTQCLAGRPLDGTIAWPAAGALSPNTLSTLQNNGVGTVVLNSSAVTPRPAKGAVPAAFARLKANGNGIVAALTSSVVERYATRALSPSSNRSAALPDLLAELAIRSAQEPDVEHGVLLTPPRYVDPDVTAAVGAIKETSSSFFTRPVALHDAVFGSLPILPNRPGGLARVPARPASALSPTLEAAAYAAGRRSAIGSLLDHHDPGARAFLAELPFGIQRAESGAWSDATQRDAAASFAADLTATVDDITSGVRIVAPKSGTYTLASNSSPLPITVDNELPYPVNVRIRIETVPPRLAGFSTQKIKPQHVDSKQKRTIKVPTTVERSGRLRIQAVLLTPDRALQLGAQGLTVRSTALGVIGIIITIVAGVVLGLALLIRFGRRLRNRRSARGKPVSPVPTGAPEPVR
jgi:hypothetical protein